MDMKEMDELLQYCAEQYEQVTCENCAYPEVYSQTCNHECYSCLYKIHRVMNHDVHYCCERILYRYVLKFQIRYASEMARCFWHIFKERDANLPIKVYSLGCGPASELYGLFGIARYLAIPVENITYKGFDLDEKWKTINMKSKASFVGQNIDFVYSDMFKYISDNNIDIDILVLNYVLSDSMRYDKAETSTIVDKIYEMIESGKVKALIINDIALFYTENSRKSAYACMLDLEKKFMENNVAVSIVKKRFSQPKAAGVEPYGDLANYNSIIFSIPNNILKYSPFTLCDSIILIIQKQ